MNAIVSLDSTVPQPATVSGHPGVKPLHRVNLEGFLREQEGKIVAVDFVKKDNKDRMLNGRLGVRKFLKGGMSTLNRLELPYLVIFDLKKAAYRAVNLATVSKVRAQGQEFAVVG